MELLKCYVAEVKAKCVVILSQSLLKYYKELQSARGVLYSNHMIRNECIKTDSRDKNDGQSDKCGD